MESKRPSAAPDVPAEVEDLQRQIEQWRHARRHREPMPEPLWREAARLARRHSVARISRFIRLDYYTLKQRVESLDAAGVADHEKTPAFVELVLPPGAPVPECTIELEHPRGGRMRIQVKGAGVPDLAALSRSFWGMGS